MQVVNASYMNTHRKMLDAFFFVPKFKKPCRGFAFEFV